jgi:tetratricopeptide (TPR) repeat protein
MAGLVSLTGCLTTGSIPDPDQQLKPGLLVGPEAIGKAAPPVELPAKESAKVCLRTAQELEMKGQTEEAIGLFEKARASDPGTAKVASRRLAVLYDKAGDFTKSTAEYEALLKANPKDADLLNDLGYSYYCRGDWTNAEAYLAKAVQQNPNHKRAWVNLGLARAQQAKWDESFQAFCQAVRPADAHCNIAFALAAQGKTEEAKAQYRQALTLDPGMQIARGALARLENPKAFDDAYATKNATKDPEAAAAQIPTIAELEDRLVKEGKLKARQQTTEKTPSIPAPTP